MAAWIELVDQDGAEPHAPERDVVRANRVGDRVKIDADLGLDTGLPVLAALQERADQLFHRDKAVAEANQVLFFNAGEAYSISHPVDGGDACLSIGVAPEILTELVPKQELRGLRRRTG